MIKTKRLVIAPFGDEDEKRMMELLRNEQIKKTFIIPDLSEDEAKKLFHMLQISSYSKEEYKRGIYKDGVFIGFINDIDIGHDEVELGYVIHPDVQRQGYASEALRAVIADLFQHAVNKIIAGAFEENIASRKVMEKCGMHKIEREETISYHDQMFSCVYYAIENN